MQITHTTDPRIEERTKKSIYAENEQLGFNGKLAVFLTKKLGSMNMFYFLAIWMFGWMILATLGIGAFKLDPYPFTFLLFLSNVVQLFSLPILAVGQQILSKSSEKQAKQTFKDTELLLKLQDEVNALLKLNTQLTEEIHKIVVIQTK